MLSTKLYIPRSRPKLVNRPRLLQQLNEGLQHTPGVTLISAPAGFGKTTLVSNWVTDLQEDAAKESKAVNRAVWLSLDEGDNDPKRFLAYLVAALQTIVPDIGVGVLGILQSPQPPPIESILTSLLNEIAAITDNFILVLDDYHAIDSKPVDKALTFLLDHLPPQMHLVIATREDPDLPLAGLRARGHLTELRAADLRFTFSETVDFLNQGMGLSLSEENITALENRTEGWIAGLQLAALSMQGQKDITSFIESFTGSHRFVLDYLVEEVLGRQPERIQTFLLYTSILERMCGQLCDEVVGMSEGWKVSTASRGDRDDPSFPADPRSNILTFQHSNQILEYLERANLFIIPLDNERRWYRYHHLFAELLRQRLGQSLTESSDEAKNRLNELHIRASQWFEDNGFELEAFQHAAAANDIERAERLIEGKGIPLHLRGAVTAILSWLDSLPRSVLDARPSLWWRYASLLLISGQSTGVEEKLQAAEAALQAKEADNKVRNLLGQIAAARATLALTRYDAETMHAQSRRALDLLHPNTLTTRANAYWTLGVAYMFEGNRAAAGEAYRDSIALAQKAGATFTTILATIGVGNVQESNNELYQAAETYKRILQLAGDQPLQIIGEVHLGLAHILYEWNDLDGAEQHGQQSLELERQYEKVIDRYIICEVFLARLKLARGDVDGAAAILAKAEQSVRQNRFVLRMPEVAATQILTLLGQGKLAEAAHLAQTYNLPLSQARVHLAQGDPSAALAVLKAYGQEAEAKDWQDECLKVMVLQAVALSSQGEKDKALQVLSNALTLAEPGGFIRIFLDEGLPMAQLLAEASAHKVMPDYVSRLLAAFEAEGLKSDIKPSLPSALPLIDPLSQRELEVLQLIAQGLSNDEIGKRLFLALDTVKGHNRKIFDKLQVQRRTEAVARARELGLL